MTALANHPDKWLRPAAAASFDRMEAAHGSPFAISSAGRTVAEQQGLIDDWNRGGPANRPPNLYLPAMPATASPHVIGGGQAVDFIDAAQRAWIDAHGAAYGWRRNIPSDIVHAIYEEDRDTHKNDAPAPAVAQNKGDEDMAIGAIVNVHDDNSRGGGNPVKLWIEAGRPDRPVNDDTARQLAKLSGQDVDNLAPSHDFERSQWNDLAVNRGQATQ
jgi:hypothetical protein